MSLLLIQINQRSKRTEKMVIEIRNDRAAGLLSSSGIELLKDKLPAMPFDDWNELVKFEDSIASDDGAHMKNDLVYTLYSFLCCCRYIAADMLRRHLNSLLMLL